MSDCESARAELRRNEDWRSRADSDVRACSAALSDAEREVNDLKRAWDHAIEVSVNADRMLGDYSRAVDDAEAHLAELAGKEGEMNYDAMLRHREELLRNAKYEYGDFAKKVEALEREAYAAAREHDAALNAASSRRNDLDMAERDARAAGDAVRAAEAEVSRACG